MYVAYRMDTWKEYKKLLVIKIASTLYPFLCNADLKKKLQAKEQ